MGGLSGFLQYLDDRRQVLERIEARLCALQSTYENHYAEISAVRDSEMEQLLEHAVGDPERLPNGFARRLEAAREQVEQEFRERLAALVRERDRLAAEAESCRRRSSEAERVVRATNVDLDREEEELKERNQRLLAAVDRYNAQIRGLGRGFGFFANFFRMRALARQRRELEEEQADVTARIDALRRRWQHADHSFAEEEVRRQEEWMQLESRRAALAAQIEALEAARASVIGRSAVDRALADQFSEPVEPGADDPPCPRCARQNPANAFFCHACAWRLQPDRMDVTGSLVEVAEINWHWRRFGDGMRAGQELIGLVRGISSGVEAFTESVRDVAESERQYPLPKLEIDVPEASVRFGRCFDEMADAVDRDLGLHPRELAATVQAAVGSTLTEESIRQYFETMGEELSRQAEAQW